MTALTLQGASKRFGQTVALHPTDLELQPGSLTLLTGPNGSGKSTLIGLSVGLLRPTDGRVLLEGRPARAPAARDGLGALVTGTLPPRRTFAQLHAAATAQDVLDELDASQLLHRRVGSLSSGQRQRVRLALALGAARRFLVLDEPLTALDTEGRALARDAVGRRVANGVTTWIATHHPAFWAPLGPDLLEIRDGRRVG